MSAKSVLRMGFLSMIVATGLFGAAEGFAADSRRADVIGTIEETVVQLDSQFKPVKGEFMRVDFIDRIGSEGPVYGYAKPMSH